MVWFYTTIMHRLVLSLGTLGSPILAFANGIGHSLVIVAEALTLKEGLRQAICASHSHIIVKGDSKILIDNIKWIHSNFMACQVPCSSYLSSCKPMPSYLLCSFWREANFVANVIAKAGHYVHISVWERCLSLWAADAFHFDLFGSGYTRGYSL